MFPPGASYHVIGSGDVAESVTEPLPQREAPDVTGLADGDAIMASTETLVLGQLFPA